MAPRIVFYRVTPVRSGRPRLRVVARYALPELLPHALSIEAALLRFETEHQLERWQEGADLMRVG